MNAIGIRLYKLTIHAGEKRDEIDFSDGTVNVLSLVNGFLNQRKDVNNNDEKQRSWFVEQHTVDGRFIRGVIKYGNYGFESDLVDRNTKESQYRRKSTDIEQIPLYFSFWIPENGSFGIIAFQSFQGKSCINIVSSDLTNYFSNRFHESKMLVRKVMPATGDASLLEQPVKKLIWMKKNQSADTADELRNLPIDLFDIEMSFTAKRRGRFGLLKDVLEELDGTSQRSTFVYQGVEFEQGCAVVRVGNRPQRVGVFGFHSNAGVIDITHQVDLAAGHPTYDSIVPVVDQLIADIYDDLTP
ncbi:MAG TPA: hypothetical protein DEF21_14965 [Thalassospira lucentensis]|uniref:DUF4747 domain-containing protein n=2 Tax=Thalassospira lucentensis TaxID=168935 RepID=A0A358HVI1_9PROT|nr:hypothetical protein [Thalassospira lucentensis]HCW66062.1 hypothetical protein [Thalassospira lucentensis]|tara:strand:+ start:2084 stop:2980 length:897 start_codon:yes stop_codon:yes gene_type:complete